MRRITAGLALLAFATSGCGGSGVAVDVPIDTSGTTTTTEDLSTTTTEGESTTTSEPMPTTTVGIDPSEAVEAYFVASTSILLQDMQPMLTSSLPGSPASLYAVHLISSVEVYPQGPQPDPAQFTDTGVRLCYTGSTDCAEVTDIAADPATGLITNFSLNDVPLDSVIRSGGSASNGPSTVTLVTAYRSPASQNLFITVDVQNTGTSDLMIAPYSSVYIGPEGRQLEILEFAPVGAEDVRPGATSRIQLVIPLANLGGTLSFEAFADSFANDVTVDLPIPA